MRCPTLAVLLFATTPIVAQEDLRVLKHGKGKSDPGKMLYNYLMGEAQKHFDARRKEVSAITKYPEARLRQAQMKRQFIKALGGFPKKTPLNAKVTGKLEREDFRIEKVVYASQPNHHVTATLYLPNGHKPPFPGVLVPCGHSKNGKAADAYQRACILMAKHGFAVLCYDPIGQGERNQLLDKQGKPAIPSSTSEHTMVGVGALLVGKNAATYRIWDGIRSLDYLASRPEVDAKRLGCTGNSGGGTLTAYLMALDDRIVAAAPSCYITSLERLFKTIGPQDAEQNITGQVAFGMEHADYVTMRAPRPTLILAASRDFFDIDGVWKTFREAKLFYGLLGYGERVSVFEYNDTHGFSRPRREAATRWMRRWLMKKDDAVFEPKFSVFTDAELQCTRSGQVLADYRGKSAFDLNREREFDLSRQRKQWQAKVSSEQLRDKIRKLIGLKKSTQTNFTKKGELIRRLAFNIQKAAFSVKPGITIPVLYQSQTKTNSNEIVICLDDRGAAAATKNSPKGRIVAFVDVRGMGETARKRGGGLTGHFGSNWQEAFLSLHLNRPLLGQRVQDVLALVDHFDKNPERGRIELIGRGTAGPIALHAAALDFRIAKVTIDGSIRSWSEVVHAKITRRQLENVVPNALAYYDLPDLRRLIAPREVIVRNSVDAMGRATK